MTTFLIISVFWINLSAFVAYEYRMNLHGFLDHFFWILLWPFVISIVELELRFELVRKFFEE